MTAAPVAPLPSRFHLELQEQARDLPQPRWLVLRCSEPSPHGAPRWERALPGALFLRTPGADPDAPGAREAIRFGVRELCIPEVVLVAHSRCAHLDPPAPLPDDCAGFEQVRRRVARSHDSLARARGHVRAALARLAADPALGPVGLVGLVHVVESGVIQAYDPEADRFEALL